MNEQIKTPKGIKIIAGLMFAMGFGIGLWCLMTLITTSLMWTTPPVGPTSVTFDPSSSWAIYIDDTVNLIFIAPLFIIDSIGLWRIKEWGLFLALIALTAKIFLEVGLFGKVLAEFYLADISGTLPEAAGIIVDGKLTLMNALCILPYLVIFWSIFCIISIVYLWKNRRYFS
jgi:hypothetical protein